MTKFLTNAPFGVQTKRFSPIGFHPGLDPSGSLQAYKNKVSPCEYNPEPHECAYKKYNKTGSLWKRKADCEEFAAHLGFRNHKILEQRRELRSMGGPGCYDISDYMYKKTSHSVSENVNFGHEVKFFQFKDVNPAPGTYTRDIIKSCVEHKQLTNKPPFEWDGFVDRFRVPSKSWSQPPNLYNPVHTKSIEAVLSKVVSKKGPYNLFTGPRDGSTIKNHFAPPKKCAPDKYYSWPNGLDYLLHHPSKRQYGGFLKDTRFRKKTTERMLMDDLTTCYRDPNEPSPATYNVQIDSIKKLEQTMYPFNDSVPIARKGVVWTIRPGPGRYHVQYPRCKRAKTQSWVFKSNTGRSEFKPLIYSLFPEVIEYLDVRCGHTTFNLMLTGTGVQPSISFKPDFLVCRLEANQGSSVEVTLEIYNGCQANIDIVFEKILELKGEMKEKPLPPPPADVKEKIPSAKKKDTSKGSKKSKGSKSSKSTKSAKGKKGKKGKKKIEKFGAQLNEDEVYSLDNFFVEHRGASFFKLSETKVDVNPLSKRSVKLCFGIMEEPEEKEVSNKKKGKGKKSSSKGSKKSSKSSKKGKGGKKGKREKDQHFYVAKYNILLGNCTFVKDIIVIGNFS